MAKYDLVRAAANNAIVRVFIADTTSTTGQGLPSLTFSSTGLAISLMRELDSAPTSYTAAGSTIETITTIGTYAAPTATKIRFKEIDGTLMKGWYELHIAQAQVGTGDASRFLGGLVYGGTSAAPVPFEIALTAVNNQSATAFMTSTALTAAERNSIADALLVRHQQGGSAGGSGTKVSDALAGGLMSLTIASGTLTVKNADGTTAYTRTLTRSALDAIVSAA